MSAYSTASFNSQVIESVVAGLQIIGIDGLRPPERLLNLMQSARVNRSVLISQYYYQRKIHLIAVLGSTAGKAGLETLIDTLQSILQGTEKTLAVPQSGATRNYTATLEGITMNEQEGGFAELDISFVCADPFGYDTSNTTMLNVVMSGSTFTPNIIGSIGGSIFASPVITVTLGTITGGTSKYIKITNPATTKFIKVTRTWSSNDILIIDCLNKTVTVNGMAVDFTGTFPDYDLGTGTLTYEDTLTTRSVTVNAVYKKRYL